MDDVLLVHGAWGDASIWHAVMAELDRDGFGVRAVQLPMTSLDDDVAWTRRAVDELDGPVTLVGHSYGGMVIAGASHADPRGASLVFVSAYVPTQSETVVELARRGGTTSGGEAIRSAPDGWTTLDPARFPDVLAGDLPGSTARVLAAAQRPTHMTCLSSPSGPVGWQKHPCAYVRTGDDRMFDPELQDMFAQRADAVVTELPASHLVPLSCPQDVASVIAGVSSPRS